MEKSSHPSVQCTVYRLNLDKPLDQGYVCPAESSGVLKYFNKYEVATPQPNRYSSGLDVSLKKKLCWMLSITWGQSEQLSCYSDGNVASFVNYNCR